MGLGIFIKMTLGVVRKEFGLHGWRAKHPTWGTTKGLCKARCHAFPPTQFSCSWISMEICGRSELKGVFPGDGGGRLGEWRRGMSKRACFLELLKNKYLEVNVCLCGAELCLINKAALCPSAAPGENGKLLLNCATPSCSSAQAALAEFGEFLGYGPV